MAFEPEEKEELKSIINEALEKLKPADPVTSIEKEIEIPVPDPPKSNEEMKEEEEGDEIEEIVTTSIFAELWKKIW